MARGSSMRAASSPGGIANEVFALGTGDTAWATIGRLPTAREHLAVTSDGAGRTFVLGGGVGSLESNLAIVDLISGQGDGAVRTIGETADEARRRRCVLVAFARGACLAGGKSPRRHEPAGRMHDGGDGTVARLPDLGVARHGLGAAVVDGTAYVVLGGRQPGLFVSDVTETIRLP